MINTDKKQICTDFILLALGLVVLLFRPTLTHAQGLNATPGYEIADKEAVDGDILIFSGGELKRTDIAYSNNIFGVLDSQALVSIDTGNGNEKPVVNSGTVLVNVTTIAGPIKKGDRITTSTILGKGQKLATSGYTLGIALADFNEAKDKIGQIPVAIKIEYSENTTPRSTIHLFDAIGTALFQNVQDPKNFGKFVKYIVAGLAIIAGFIVSFVLFSKSASKSIDAIGRNPLAKGPIYAVVWANVLLAALIAVIGAAAGILIINIP